MTINLAPMQRENMTARIYREIKQKIMMGELRPGDTITLRSITDTLGVSQTPVREALLQLVSERALTLSPGKSVKVPELTVAQLQELRSIRLELECFAARRAAPLATPALIDELRGIHANLMASRQHQLMAPVLARNFDFHFALYSAAQMPHLLSMIENLWVQTASYLSYLYTPPFPTLPGVHPHEGIIAGLQSGDTEAVVREIRRDIEGHGEFLIRYLTEHGLAK
jgi:DNA-binding GntR family transcriptional regulator